MSRHPTPLPPSPPPHTPLQVVMAGLVQQEQYAAEECRWAAEALRKSFGPFQLSGRSDSTEAAASGAGPPGDIGEASDAEVAHVLAEVLEKIAAANEERVAVWTSRSASQESEQVGERIQSSISDPRVPIELSPSATAEKRARAAVRRSETVEEVDVVRALQMGESAQTRLALGLATASGMTTDTKLRSTYASALRAIAESLEEARRVAGVSSAVWADIPYTE